MLRKHHLLLALAASLPLVIWGSGCVVKTTDTGAGGSTTLSTGSNSGCTASEQCPVVHCAADGTDDRQVCEQGVCITDPGLVCSGGPTSSSTTASGMGGSGGTGSCTGPTGTGRTASACESMPISPPETCVDMGQTIETYGYTACTATNMLWNPGNWEEFQDCLAAITMASECDVNPVVDCVSQTRVDSCDNPSADANCKTIHDTCGMANPPQDFDTAKCMDDMKIYTDAAFNDLVTCINNETSDCQTAYDTCFALYEQ